MNKRRVFYASLATLMMVSCAPKHYQLTNVERTRVIVDSRFDKTPDEAAVKFLEPFKRVNDSIMGPVVGVVARNMHADRPESNLSNLLADILVWSAKDYNEKAVLGIYNMGGIRADLTKGNVTYGDVLDVAPFENKICFITLTGEQMLTLFRQMLKLQSNGAFDINDAVGKICQVYMRIPADGMGKVQVSFNGSIQELDARSAGPNPIQSGAKVRVTSVVGRVLIVEEA